MPLRPEANPRLRIGSVIEVSGSRMVVELDRDLRDLDRQHEGRRYAVGQFGSIIKVHYGSRLIFAIVSLMRMKGDYLAEQHGAPVPVESDARVLEAQLLGEGRFVTTNGGTQGLVYERGVIHYPLPQQAVYLTTQNEIRSIFAGPASDSIISVGRHVGVGVDCEVDIDRLFGRHVAVLGSTGSGKSGTVAAILHSVIERESDTWHPHIVIIDAHGEYAHAFPEGQQLRPQMPEAFRLPAWLSEPSNLFELVTGSSIDRSFKQWGDFKDEIVRLRKEWVEEQGGDASRVSADTPWPFGIQALKERLEALTSEGKKVVEPLERATRDRQLAFSLRDRGGVPDEFVEVMRQLISTEHRVSVIDVSTLPSSTEGLVVEAVVGLLFNYKVRQSQSERVRDPIIIVCEEAHRYVPHKGDAATKGARHVVSRVAKEGRKYGIGLMLVSQRPSEVEATVLSQCSTWMVMRLTNPDDQSAVRAFMPDGMTEITEMLSGLRHREALFVGHAATVPSRIQIRELPKGQQPQADDPRFVQGWSGEANDDEAVQAVIDRWRSEA